MLISKRHNFIFIHIYKNAGTSVTKALMPYSVSKAQKFMFNITNGRGVNTINSLFGAINKSYNPRPYYGHITASELISKLGFEEYNKFFSFAIVRNPWDWQVSLYKYMLKAKTHHQHHKILKFQSFTDYIYWRCENEVRLQKNFIYSEEGEKLIDFIGRFEELERDFYKICNRIGISVKLPRLNVSNTKPYRDFYNSETKKLVEEAFYEDIKLFDYDF